MAAYASNDAEEQSIWKLLVKRTPGRLEFAARLALICTLVTILAEVYRTPEIALTVYIAFFMNKPDRTSSMALTIGFTVVVTIVIGLLLALAQFVVGDPAMRLLTMALLSFIMMFMASASKLKPLAATVGLVLAYALDLLGQAPGGELATRALLYAWLFVGLPALVSAVINLLIAPAPRSLAERKIADRLRGAAKVLRTGITHEARDGMRSMWQGDKELQAYFKLAGMEKTTKGEELAALEGASDCLVTILSAVQLMVDEPSALPPRNMRQAIADRLCEAASAFEAGGYPAKIEPVVMDNDLSELTLTAISILNRGLLHFGELRPEPPAGSRRQEAGFFASDAFTNPVHVQFALKVTGAAMLCYLFYSILNWPGIHTALITCFLVLLGTAGESVEKLTLRIVGCLAGAGLGILIMLRVIPYATNIVDLAVIVFVGAFLGAWVSAGDKHISYAGFQIAFAYFLCVIQGASPSFNMVVARDRVIGILIGNLVSYYIATCIWPVSVGPRIATTLQSVAQSFQAMVESTDRWAWQRRAAETNTMLEQISSDILLASYEPVRIRPRSAWLEAQQGAGEAARKLNEALVDVLEETPQRPRSVLLRIMADSSAEGAGSVSRTCADMYSATPLEALLCARNAEFRYASSARGEVMSDE